MLKIGKVLAAKARGLKKINGNYRIERHVGSERASRYRGGGKVCMCEVP